MCIKQLIVLKSKMLCFRNFREFSTLLDIYPQSVSYENQQTLDTRLHNECHI